MGGTPPLLRCVTLAENLDVTFNCCFRLAWINLTHSRLFEMVSFENNGLQLYLFLNTDAYFNAHILKVGNSLLLL